MQQIRSLECKADRELAQQALSDGECWDRLVEQAIEGDEVALATLSLLCGRLIYSMHPGRHRWVDDHAGDVLEALWTAIMDRPASPADLLRAARRVMQRAAQRSQRAMRDLLSAQPDTAAGCRTASRFEDDLVGTLDARDRLSTVLPVLNEREREAFSARAGLIERSAETASATARSAVRNARRRLVAS
jgi:hypothetical protein